MNTHERRGCPSQPSSPQRNAINQPVSRTSRSSIARQRLRAKHRRRRIALLLAVTAVIVLVAASVFKTAGSEDAPAVPIMATASQDPTATPRTTPAATPEPVATPEPTPEPARYVLTADERELVERVVMAEAGGESFEGQVLVAQCILNACEKDGERPPEVVVAYKYAKGRPTPTQSVRDAVTAVFDAGETSVTAPILYFYNPNKTTSRWHESQEFIVEVGGHRFFAEKGAGK